MAKTIQFPKSKFLAKFPLEKKKEKKKCSPLKRSIFARMILASALVIKLLKWAAERDEQIVLLLPLSLE